MFLEIPLKEGVLNSLKAASNQSKQGSSMVNDSHKLEDSKNPEHMFSDEQNSFIKALESIGIKIQIRQ